MSTTEALALPSPASLEAVDTILTELARFGRPTLCLTTRGWWCYVDIHVNATSTSMDVKSESNHPSPIAAARECAQRVIATVKRFST